MKSGGVSLLIFTEMTYLFLFPLSSFSNSLCDTSLNSIGAVSEAQGDPIVQALALILEEGIISFDWLEEWAKSPDLAELVSELQNSNAGIPYARMVLALSSESVDLEALSRWMDRKRVSEASSLRDMKIAGILVKELSGTRAFEFSNGMTARFSPRLTWDQFDGDILTERRSAWKRPDSETRYLRVYLDHVSEREGLKKGRVLRLPKVAVGQAHIYSKGDNATLWIPVVGGSVLVYRLSDFSLLKEISLEGTIISPIWPETKLISENGYRKEVNVGRRLTFVTSQGVIYFFDGEDLTVERKFVLSSVPERFCYSQREGKVLYHLKGDTKFRSIDPSQKFAQGTSSDWCSPGGYLNGFIWEGVWYGPYTRESGLFGLVDLESGAFVPGEMSSSGNYLHVRRNRTNGEVYFTNHKKSTVYDGFEFMNSQSWTLTTGLD